MKGKRSNSKCENMSSVITWQSRFQTIRTASIFPTLALGMRLKPCLTRQKKTLNYHELKMMQYEPKSKRWVFHARNFKALQGVVKTLRWTLGDKNVSHPLE